MPAVAVAPSHASTRRPHQHGVDPSPVAGHQHRERGGVTHGKPSDDRLVGELRRILHARNRLTCPGTTQPTPQTVGPKVRQLLGIPAEHQTESEVREHRDRPGRVHGPRRRSNRVFMTETRRRRSSKDWVEYVDRLSMATWLP